ncbi:hypothetical protein [Methylobacterium sp. WL8]|uniref:hypothetical protein n=1 Tax=Methylobacterium sp. WL8 TaxID=2603899 RepID=UPI0011C7C1FA|nr:hypothetical protein [Methylobacterium sp. WL8]TXN78281.1 hypothetical protein FV234_22975 [Methylobacterium sp. WL8]
MNIRSSASWVIGIVAFIYLIADIVLANNDLNIAVDVVLCVIAFMALCYYSVRAAVAVWTGSQAYVDYLIVAIALGWMSQSGQAGLRAIARLSGFDRTFTDSEIFGILKLMSIVAALMHILPRGAANGQVPKSNRTVIVGGLIFAIVAAVTVVTVHPDPKPLIEMMPMWSRDTFRTGSNLPPGAPPA